MNMNLSKIGRKYEVISDSDGIWAPGTIVVAIEEGDTAPWCVLEEDYIKGDFDLENKHCMSMDELRDLTLPIHSDIKREIEVEISINHSGFKHFIFIEVDENATKKEIDEAVEEAVMNMLNFTWRDAR